jgi:hypothetical protein
MFLTFYCTRIRKGNGIRMAGVTIFFSGFEYLGIHCKQELGLIAVHKVDFQESRDRIQNGGKIRDFHRLSVRRNLMWVFMEIQKCPVFIGNKS